MTLTLEQSGCDVVGSVEGRNKTPIKDGTVENWTETFTAMARNQGNGQDIGIAWQATVDGNDVSGTLNSPIMGTIEFTDTRVEGRV